MCSRSFDDPRGSPDDLRRVADELRRPPDDARLAPPPADGRPERRFLDDPRGLGPAPVDDRDGRGLRPDPRGPPPPRFPGDLPPRGLGLPGDRDRSPLLSRREFEDLRGARPDDPFRRSPATHKFFWEFSVQ